MAFPAKATLVDAFTRGDASLSGTACTDGIHYWSTAEWGGGTVNLQTISNTLRAAGAGAAYLTAQATADCEVYATITTVPTGSGYLQLALRLADVGTANWDGYVLFMSATGLQIRVVTNGSPSIDASNGTTFANGDKIGFVAMGSELKGYRYTGGAWSEVISLTNTAYKAAGYTGISIGNDTNTIVVDDLYAGDLPLGTYAGAVQGLSPSSYWRLASDDSATADYGSNGYSLTLSGSPTATTSLIPTEQSATNQALTLDGTSQYFSVASDVYDFAGDFTLLWWMKPSSTDFDTDYRRIFNKRDAADPYQGQTYHFSPGGNLYVEWDRGAASETSTFDMTFASGTTSFCVITWEATAKTMRVYQDGNLIDTDGTSFVTDTKPPVSGANFLIGHDGNDRWFPGVLDEVAVWDGVRLTDAQISALWVAANSSGAKHLGLLGVG